MAVTRPIAGQGISAETFGQPVADAINKMLLTMSANGVKNTNVPSGTANRLSLTLPAANVPVGRKVLVIMTASISQATAAAVDVAFYIGTNQISGVQQFATGVSPTGAVATWSYVYTGEGADKLVAMDVYPWGAQPANIMSSSICALFLPI